MSNLVILAASVLLRDATLARYMLSLCVCLSVRPSHAGICTKTAKHRITHTTPTIARRCYFSGSKC